MSVQVKGSGTIGGLDEGLNVVGVVTATSFSGALSGTTGTFSGTVQVTSGNLDIADSIRHVGDSNTKMRFPTADTISFETAGNERLRIDSSGRLGVGVNSFHDTSTRLQLQSPGSDHTGIVITAAATSTLSYIYFGDTADKDIGRLVYENSSDSMQFWTNNAERLRIDSSGRLLVGAAAIQYHNAPFYASGTGPVIAAFHSSSGGTNDQARIALGALANNPPYNRGVYLTAENNGAGHDFLVACSASHALGPSEKLRILSDGRVLIGTNSTHNSNSYSNNLIIYENGDTGASIIGNNSNSNYASLYLSDTSTPSRSYLESQLGSNGNFTIGHNGTGRLRYVLNGSEKFCMTHTGRFGVGDTDPDFAVHLKSNVPAICFEDTDGTHGQAIIEQNGDELKIRQDAGNASSGTGSTILFQVDASTKMRIDGTGYVGINRTSPAHYLDVDGTSLFRNRVFISTGLSMKSTPFGANVTYDTGISVNGGGYGGSILAICSKNFGAGTNTQSGVYLLKFHYDGNTGPSVTLIAGSNLATFGKSGSNTLTVFMGASNNMFTAIESSVVNA